VRTPGDEGILVTTGKKGVSLSMVAPGPVIYTLGTASLSCELFLECGMVNSALDIVVSSFCSRRGNPRHCQALTFRLKAIS
jgi:hypothetical protein